MEISASAIKPTSIHQYVTLKMRHDFVSYVILVVIALFVLKNGCYQPEEQTLCRCRPLNHPVEKGQLTQLAALLQRLLLGFFEESGDTAGGRGIVVAGGEACYIALHQVFFFFFFFFSGFGSHLPLSKNCLEIMLHFWRVCIIVQGEAV